LNISSTGTLSFFGLVQDTLKSFLCRKAAQNSGLSNWWQAYDFVFWIEIFEKRTPNELPNPEQYFRRKLIKRSESTSTIKPLQLHTVSTNFSLFDYTNFPWLKPLQNPIKSRTKMKGKLNFARDIFALKVWWPIDCFCTLRIFKNWEKDFYPRK
jgi:hypothetical protein